MRIRGPTTNRGMSDNQLGARVVGIQLAARAMQGPSRGELGCERRETSGGEFARFAAGENSKVRSFVGRAPQRACTYIRARTLIHGWYFARRVYFKASPGL